MDLDALLLDAGNTVVFLDMAAVRAVLAEHAVAVSVEALTAAEGAAKRAYARRQTGGADHLDSWSPFMDALLVAAGVPEGRARELVPHLRAAHDTFNLWRRVPADLGGALDDARALGLRLGVVSNSEGAIEELLDHLGLADEFDVIVDSAVVGVSKPDPRIFRFALDALAVNPQRALYAGDIPEVDIAGAHAANMHAALIDPLGFFPGFDEAPTFASVRALVSDLQERV